MNCQFARHFQLICPAESCSCTFPLEVLQRLLARVSILTHGSAAREFHRERARSVGLKMRGRVRGHRASLTCNGDLAARRAAEPWCEQKSESAFEHMFAKLRRILIAARSTPTAGDQPGPDIIRHYAQACATAAA